MRRLTEYRKDLKRYEYKQDEKGYCFIQEGQIVNKLGRLEDLEEQLGCPLNVYVGINQCDITTVYDKEGIEHIIRPNTIIKDSFMAVNGFTLIKCMWNMYCKTWWLKKNREE